MKKKRVWNVLIVAVLIAFLGVCLGLIFGFRSADVMTAKAEETSIESPQDSAESPVTSETDKTGETPEEDIGFDLDAFLEWVQKYADEAGIGDEYAKAVEAIKAAASEKQVTISTVASVAQLVVFLVYLIYTNVRNGKLKKQLKEVSEKLDLQLKGTNGLIDESNANGETGQSTKQEVEALTKAFLHLLTGFTVLTDRFNIGAESKEAVKREFNRAAREIDGEGKKEKADEENQAL